MRRDPRVYLWDIEQCVTDIFAFTEGKTYADYQGQRLLQAAVERKFEVIGEALVRLARYFPAEAEQIEGYGQLIGFRNVLANQYDNIDVLSVWKTVELYLPDFHNQVRVLRAEFDRHDPIEESGKQL